MAKLSPHPRSPLNHCAHCLWGTVPWGEAWTNLREKSRRFLPPTDDLLGADLWMPERRCIAERGHSLSDHEKGQWDSPVGKATCSQARLPSDLHMSIVSCMRAHIHTCTNKCSFCVCLRFEKEKKFIQITLALNFLTSMGLFIHVRVPCVVQAGSEFVILLPKPSQCWDYNHVLC